MQAPQSPRHRASDASPACEMRALRHPSLGTGLGGGQGCTRPAWFSELNHQALSATSYSPENSVSSVMLCSKCLAAGSGRGSVLLRTRTLSGVNQGQQAGCPQERGGIGLGSEETSNGGTSHRDPSRLRRAASGAGDTLDLRGQGTEMGSRSLAEPRSSGGESLWKGPAAPVP